MSPPAPLGPAAVALAGSTEVGDLLPDGCGSRGGGGELLVEVRRADPQVGGEREHPGLLRSRRARVPGEGLQKARRELEVLRDRVGELRGGELRTVEPRVSEPRSVRRRDDDAGPVPGADAVRDHVRVRALRERFADHLGGVAELLPLVEREPVLEQRILEEDQRQDQRRRRRHDGSEHVGSQAHGTVGRMRRPPYAATSSRIR